MKLIRIIHKTCLLPLALLVIMLAMLLAKGAESAYSIHFIEAEITTEDTEQVVIYVSGANMLRVNSFYINGERLEDCDVERMTYSMCRVAFDSSAFVKGNTWYELQVGHHKWGFIDLLSSPVWIEWTGS